MRVVYKHANMQVLPLSAILSTPREYSTMKPPSSSLATSFMDLPSELHVQIAGYLTYPDALALKHTCRHFYHLVPTGVNLKVEWLIERFERNLECPMEKCSFRTDEAFCNWRIRRIMERRRRHRECRRVAGGCNVIVGQTCHPDLLPSWLRKEVLREVVQATAMLVYEGRLHKLLVHCDPSHEQDVNWLV